MVIKNKMQQKMLSDQPLRQVRQTKSRSNINDGFCALGLCLWLLSFGGFCAMACRNTFAFAFLWLFFYLIADRLCC